MKEVDDFESYIGFRGPTQKRKKTWIGVILHLVPPFQTKNTQSTIKTASEGLVAILGCVKYTITHILMLVLSISRR